VCGGGVIKNPVNANLRTSFAHILEEASSAAEQHRGQGDFQLVDDTQVQVLLEHVRTARDADIATVRRLPGSLKGTRRAVIDEAERRPSRPDPGLALLAGQDEYRPMKRGLLGSCDPALREHSLAHDIRTGALHGLTNHVVERTGLPPNSRFSRKYRCLKIQPIIAPYFAPNPCTHGLPMVIPSGAMWPSRLSPMSKALVMIFLLRT